VEGVKLSKLPQLKALMDYEAKQKQKCCRTTLKALADSPSEWVERFAQLAGYGHRFEGISGQRMLQLTNEDLRGKFGIESNVDRQYAPCGLMDRWCLDGLQKQVPPTAAGACAGA
jgi:hypothetical protein